MHGSDILCDVQVEKGSSSMFKKIFFHPLSAVEEKLPAAVVTVLQVFLASCFIGICSQIKIPLFFTPVPLTLQTPAVILTGGLLGARKGAYAVLAYLFQGAAGLPVFAGGSFGALILAGPSAAYLWGFPLLAYFVGKVTEKKRSLVFYMLALAGGTVFHELLGSLWLSRFVGLSSCLRLGFYPFIAFDLAKAIPVGLYLFSRR